MVRPPKAATPAHGDSVVAALEVSRLRRVNAPSAGATPCRGKSIATVATHCSAILAPYRALAVRLAVIPCTKITVGKGAWPAQVPVSLLGIVNRNGTLSVSIR